MPKCRECGARLSKFDSDVCPVCGCKKPLDGVESSTVDFTQEFSAHDRELNGAKVRSKLVVFLLFLLIGWTGAPWFYMLFRKRGFLWLIENLVLIGALGTALYLAGVGYFGFIAAAAVSYLINIIFGVIVFVKNNVKDGAGEFIR